MYQYYVKYRTGGQPEEDDQHSLDEHLAPNERVLVRHRTESARSRLPNMMPERDTPERDSDERDNPEQDTPERDTPERDMPEGGEIEQPIAELASGKDDPAAAAPVSGTEPTAERRHVSWQDDVNRRHIMSADQRRASETSLSSGIREHFAQLRADIIRRTQAIKRYVTRPPTPEAPAELTPEQRAERQRRQSITEMLGAILPPSPVRAKPEQPSSKWSPAGLWYTLTYHLPESIDNEGTGYTWWLAVVVVAWVYNAVFVPIRMTYPYQTADNVLVWMCFDWLFDLVYLADMVLVQPRLRFVHNGHVVKDGASCRRNYLRSRQLKYDLVALLPLDLLYVVLGPRAALRLPRLVKYRCYFSLFNLLDGLVSFPVALRIWRTLSYMLYMVHCNSCIYFFLSEQQAFGQLSYWDPIHQRRTYNRWVYNNQGNAYIRCFYFTTKLAITIGNNAPPTNVIEYLYMYASWMIGLFVFAMLLGQIRDIVTNASRNREDFRNNMDAALQFCHTMKVPGETQRRVRAWFIYTWESQKVLDETQAISRLPMKLQRDLAISVHYQTLAKVQLFEDCERALLRDLVLKLQPVLYLPGDYICRKGEVGKEMYIVTKGVLQVVGGENDEKVFVELKEGTVFGEISLLAVGGGNRRTANVRSKGFSNLFLLAKDDLYAALVDYPEAQSILRLKAKQLLEKDKDKQLVEREQAEQRAQLQADSQIHKHRQAALRFANVVRRAVMQKHLLDVEDEQEIHETSSTLVT